MCDNLARGWDSLSNQQSPQYLLLIKLNDVDNIIETSDEATGEENSFWKWCPNSR